MQYLETEQHEARGLKPAVVRSQQPEILLVLWIPWPMGKKRRRRLNHVFTTETTQTTTLVLGLFPTMESKRRGNSLQTRNSTSDGVPFSRTRTRSEPSSVNGLARTIQISWHLSRIPPSAQPEMDENIVEIFGILDDEICDSCFRLSCFSLLASDTSLTLSLPQMDPTCTSITIDVQEFPFSHLATFLDDFVVSHAD